MLRYSTPPIYADARQICAMFILLHMLYVCMCVFRAALVLPDAVFLEGAANPVQLCAALVLPDNSLPLEVVFLNPFILPLIFTAGTAGNDD